MTRRRVYDDEHGRISVKAFTDTPIFDINGGYAVLYIDPGFSLSRLAEPECNGGYPTSDPHAQLYRAAGFAAHIRAVQQLKRTLDSRAYSSCDVGAALGNLNGVLFVMDDGRQPVQTVVHAALDEAQRSDIQHVLLSARNNGRHFRPQGIRDGYSSFLSRFPPVQQGHRCAVQGLYVVLDGTPVEQESYLRSLQSAFAALSPPMALPAPSHRRSRW